MRVIEIDGELCPVRFQKGTGKHSLVVNKPDGTRIAWISWQEYTGEIKYIEVRKDQFHNYRRRGIATALLKLAREYAPIKHATDRTPDGERWAQSLNEELPDRRELFSHESICSRIDN
jgi:hypothetical protein